MLRNPFERQKRRKYRQDLERYFHKLTSDETVQDEDVVRAHLARVALLAGEDNFEDRELLARAIETLLEHDYRNTSMLLLREMAQCCEAWPKEWSPRIYWFHARLIQENRESLFTVDELPDQPSEQRAES